MQLNELPDWLVPLLPRTDSRFRPDQRALENGNVELAGNNNKSFSQRKTHSQTIENVNGVPLFVSCVVYVSTTNTLVLFFYFGIHSK